MKDENRGRCPVLRLAEGTIPNGCLQNRAASLVLENHSRLSICERGGSRGHDGPAMRFAEQADRERIGHAERGPAA
jgi:hypothetical protein